jgi:hypothetical protein
MSTEGKPGGIGLVDVADLGAVLCEAAVKFVDGLGVRGNIAVGAEIAGGIGDGDGDGFGMDIEADVLDFLGSE